MPRSLPICLALLATSFAPNPQASAQSEGAFAETIDVRRVEIDVVVTDQSGQRVQGLGIDEFELLIDGKSFPIREISEHRANAPTAAAAPPAAIEPSLSNDTEAVDPTPPVDSSPAPVTWVLYLDSSLTAPGPRNDALKQTRTFLEKSAGPNDRFLAANFDGRLLRFNTPLVELGETKGGLSAAVTALLREAGSASGRRARAQSVLMMSSDLATLGLQLGRAASNPQLFLAEISGYVAEEELSARNSLRSLNELIRLLSGISDQRVALIYVGTAISIRPGAALAEQCLMRLSHIKEVRLELPLRIQSIPSLMLEYNAMLQFANAGRITFFTIDTGSGDYLEISPAERTDMPSLGDVVAAPEYASMPAHALAVATGGRAFRTGPKLDRNLSLALDDLRTYYSLTYEPLSEPGKTHRVEVRVKRPGLVALHREHVAERTVVEQGQDAALLALLAPAKLDDLGARARIGDGKAGSRTLPVKIEIPLAHVALLPSGDAHVGRIALHFAAADGIREYRRLESREFSFRVEPGKLDSARTEHVVYTIELPPVYREWRLSVLVVDSVGGGRSSVELALPAKTP